MQLLTAPQRERQRFRGTPDELREEIRRVYFTKIKLSIHSVYPFFPQVLTGNYAGNVDDMVEVLSEAVLKEHRMAKLLKARRIPFDLMLASFNFCSRFLALETVEIVDDEPEPQPPAASNAAESEKKKNGGKEGEGSEPVCNGTAAAKHVSSSNNGGGNEEEEAMEDWDDQDENEAS